MNYPAHSGALRRWSRLLTPRPDGLPQVRLLVGFPLIVLLVVIVLTAFGVSGSSTGMWWTLIHGSQSDPSLLFGTPQANTSDMWLVQDSWIASQAAQGFPATNQTLPGGMDATFMNDLPAWEWSTIFRPHLWGYLILPLAQGNAWRWLFIGGVTVASIYAFSISLAPRRPGVAVLISLFTLYSPLLQWWYRPQTLLPLAWCFVTLTAVRWLLKATRGTKTPVVLAVLAGYLAIPTALTIYVPFIVPCALVIAFVALGQLLDARRATGITGALRRLVPLLVSAAAAGAVLLIWALTRWETIKAVMATVYPGHRRSSTGACQETADACTAYFADAWNVSLLHGVTGSLASNLVESSTVIQVEVYLLPVLLLVAAVSMRRRQVDWTVTLTVLCTIVFLAFIIIPGWDSIAEFLALDMSVATRMRLGLLALSVVAISLVVSRRDEQEWATGTSVRASVLTGLTTLAIQAIVWWQYHEIDDPILSVGLLGKALVIMIAVGVALVPTAVPWIGMSVLLVATLLIAGKVNPIYVGWTDLSETAMGQAVEEIDAADPGTWVGLTAGERFADTTIPTGVLLATGVQAYNGVQTYPPTLMWEQIDPSGSQAEQWNRLANVKWVPGSGEPTVSNPARDQIQVTFDSCSSFADQNVAHVLSTAPVDQDCLVLDRTVQDGEITGYIYSVVTP